MRTRAFAILGPSETRGQRDCPPKLFADQLDLYQSGKKGGRLSPLGFSDLPTALPYPEAAAQKSLFDYYFFSSSL